VARNYKKRKFPLASIIIPNWNGKHFLKDCLSSLLKQDYPKLEIILVDNNSSDGSVEYVRENFPSVRIVKNDKNLGVAGGINSGIRIAKGEYLIALNNDMTFRKDCVSELVKAAESDKKIGIVGGMWLQANKPKVIQNITGASSPKVLPEISFSKLTRVMGNFTEQHPEEDRGQYTELIEVDGTVGLIKREVIEKIGLYDEKFFFTYEDTDFSYRAKEAGYRVVINPNAKIWHVWGGSMNLATVFYTYHSYSGKLRFGLKHFKGFKKAAFIASSIIQLPFLCMRFILIGKPNLIVHLFGAYWWNVINFKDYL